MEAQRVQEFVCTQPGEADKDGGAEVCSPGEVWFWEGLGLG